MVKGRIEGPTPTVFLSLSEQELDRLRAGEMVEVPGAERLGVDASAARRERDSAGGRHRARAACR
jgi:hypothetical protein